MGVLCPPVQPPAVSPCRAGPEYQVHRGDGREPDRASPAAFQQQAGRKVKNAGRRAPKENPAPVALPQPGRGFACLC